MLPPSENGELKSQYLARAPSFAFFAKGGYHARIRLRAGSCKERKNGAPSAGMVYANIVKDGPPAGWPEQKPKGIK